MANGRGGYQRPGSPASVSGPGKFSKRTDGGVQPITEPSIDTPGLEYGDRGRLTEAQRIAHAAAGQGGTPPGPSRMTGQMGTGTKLPPFLFDSPSQNPLEAGSAGLPTGAGPGPEALAASQPAPDEREAILEYLVQTFGNADAAKMLHAIRESKAAPAAAPAAVPAAESTLKGDVALPQESAPAPTVTASNPTVPPA